MNKSTASWLLILTFLLSACSQAPERNSAVATGKPFALRAIDDTVLSVVVRIDDDVTNYRGELRNDGRWYVDIDVSLDTSHTFQASWFGRVNQTSVLLLEQRGSFFANSNSMFAQAPADITAVSAGFPQFDSDCDNATNLEELESGADPLSNPGCVVSTDSTANANNSDSATNASPNTPSATSTPVVSEPMTDTPAAGAPITDTPSVDTPIAETPAVVAPVADSSTDNEGSNEQSSPANDSTNVASNLTEIPEVRALNGGCFDMGSQESDPFHRDDQQFHVVCLQPFAMGVYEVTFDQYIAFAGSPGVVQVVPHDRTWGFGTRPVINVSYNDAVAYTDWLSEQTGDRYRLPTEAEWEYAARADTSTPFWTGESLRDDQEHFKSSDPWGGGIATGQPDRDRTRPVGSLQANPFGLYDMLGNVKEHTCSVYQADYDGVTENTCTVDPNVDLIHRGAAYNYDASWARVYRRTEVLAPFSVDGGLGFRVVREIP